MTSNSLEGAALQARFEFGLVLIREAGALAMGYSGRLASLTIRSKGVQDMASEADMNTELLIRERLQAEFPGDGFLGEETGVTDYDASQGVWVVDPIDGTRDYLRGRRGIERGRRRIEPPECLAGGDAGDGRAFGIGQRTPDLAECRDAPSDITG